MQTKRIFIVAVFVFLILEIFAQQDKVYTASGDILIGELKSFQRGVLVFDTDYADSEFQIDWDEINGVAIGRSHLIYTADGGKYKGGLVPLGRGRLTRLVTADGEITMSLDEIVEIASLDKRFWDRMIVSIDAGLSITKANNVKQSSAQANISYRGDKWLLSGNFSNVGTTQDDVDPTVRTEGGLFFTRDLFGNAIIMGGADFLSNSEQLLDLRSTGKAGFGYYFFRSNQLYLLAGAGFALSNERYGGDNATSGNSFEGLGAVEFNAYNLGDLSFLARLMTYPSLTDPGRWRINADFSLKYDLPLDFYVKLTYTHNFDSDPLIDVPRNDYVFKTSLGWEWD
ncbi:MAG: DUF481 domain-containing protein [Bacteroidota bacterium]